MFWSDDDETITTYGIKNYYYSTRVGIPSTSSILRCYDHSKPGKFLTFLTAYFVTTKFCLEQIFIIFVNFRCFSRRIKKFHGKMLFCSYPSQTPKFIIFQKKNISFFFFSHRRKKNHTRKVHFLQASANALKTLWITNKNWAKLTLLNGHEQKIDNFFLRLDLKV